MQLPLKQLPLVFQGSCTADRIRSAFIFCKATHYLQEEPMYIKAPFNKSLYQSMEPFLQRLNNQTKFPGKLENYIKDCRIFKNKYV